MAENQEEKLEEETREADENTQEAETDTAAENEEAEQKKADEQPEQTEDHGKAQHKAERPGPRSVPPRGRLPVRRGSTGDTGRTRRMICCGCAGQRFPASAARKVRQIDRQKRQCAGGYERNNAFKECDQVFHTISIIME